MQSRHSTILLFVRWPAPGRVKTRLAASIGAEEASRVHTVLAERTFREAVQVVGARIVVCGTGARPDAFRHWLPGAFAYWEQPCGGLGERLAVMFARAFDLGPGGVMAIGSDSPTLDATAISAAAEALGAFDVCVLPAEDGGYVLIGFHRAAPALFTEMPWSTADLLRATEARCKAEGLSLFKGETHCDVDILEDWQRFSQRSEFAGSSRGGQQ